LRFKVESANDKWKIRNEKWKMENEFPFSSVELPPPTVCS
jgi:hypothetical protein